MKEVYLAAALCLTGTYSAVSQATCTFLSGSATDSENINFGNIVVQRDTPIGATLATATASALNSRDNFIMCQRIGDLQARWSAEGVNAITFNGEQLFDSGIAGIAMRVITPGAGGTTGLYGAAAFSRSITNMGCAWNANTSWFCGNTWGPTNYQLVKIAAVTGSGIFTIPGRIRASVVDQTYVYNIGFSSASVTTVACSVTNSSVPVPMGDVSTTAFKGVGSTSNEVNLSIPLDCDAGTKVNVVLDGTRDSSGAVGVLALDSSSGTAASGIGLQLLYNSTAVSLGTSIAVGTVVSSGAYTIPLVARYYQTGATVTAGKADSTATFTMTYN